MKIRIRYNHSMKLLLATLHAKYVHSSLALPYLAVACKGIDGVGISILECTINEPKDQLLRRFVAEEADLVAFSCYIWNINQTLKLASDLKKIHPDTFVLLGGPEVSYNSEEILHKNRAVDCIIRGEGEETFRELIDKLAQYGLREEALRSIPSGIAFRSGEKIIVTSVARPVPDLDAVPSPFTAGMADTGKPLVYFETSRDVHFPVLSACHRSKTAYVRSPWNESDRT